MNTNWRRRRVWRQPSCGRCNCWRCGPTAVLHAHGIIPSDGRQSGDGATLVDQLEKRGLAVRQRSDRDRCQTNVVITDPVHEALTLAPDALQQRFVQDFRRLADWEQTVMIASLERVPVLSLADVDRLGKLPQEPDGLA